MAFVDNRTPVGAELQPSVPLSHAQSKFIVERALGRSGLNIDARKTDFIHLRVSKRLKALNLGSFDDYIMVLKNDADGSETHMLVEALTTHTTSFFREKHQYEWLQQEGLKRLTQNRPGAASNLLIWSAACSTGAELWSAGMVLSDAVRMGATVRNFALLGTDISRRILKTAQNATYSEMEIGGIGAQHRHRYLMQSRQRFGSSNTYYFRVVPELREKARFEEANLCALSTARQFSADIVFLRNVLIYFDGAMQRSVLDGVISRLKPGGILFTGHSEAIPSRPGLRVLGPSIYEKE